MASKMSTPFQQQAQQQVQHSDAVPIQGHGPHQAAPESQKERNGSGSYDLYRTFSPSDVGLWSALHSKEDAGSGQGGFWSKFWGK
jgi:hypothetical protein